MRELATAIVIVAACVVFALVGCVLDTSGLAPIDTVDAGVDSDVMSVNLPLYTDDDWAPYRYC